jgi:hypothetical protein
MSLITKIKKKEIKDFIKFLKRRIKKENPEKRLYSSVYHITDFSNILNGDTPRTGEIGAVIKEGFPFFGKTLVKLIIPGDVEMDSSVCEYIKKDVSKFSNKCTLAYFEEY